jgi:phosphoribosylamine---glycine ligase
MNVLVIGSGGREHAICWKLSKSPRLSKLYCAKGSAGISQVAKCIDIDPKDFEAISRFCSEKNIDMVVVGPELPLANGIADYIRETGVWVFGPSKQGAKLESSKLFAKNFMKSHNIPTAEFNVFNSVEEAREKIKNVKFPVVIKADGLAAGKGVRICSSLEEAQNAITDFMDNRIFGASGDKIVAEEFLTGKEASIMAFCDGNSYCLLPPSRDHKRLNDGNEGPNTGGMGVFSPVSDLSEETLKQIKTEVFDRFIAGIKKENIFYIGVIYAGIMLTEDGPKVLEFNCRFGDPETQAILPLLKTDLLEIMEKCMCCGLEGCSIEVEDSACVSVVLASAGYPEKPETGKLIEGLNNDFGSDVKVFHAGTKKENDKWMTSGGRVLALSAKGKTIGEAREKAYKAVSKIKFEGVQKRTDIGA